MSLPSPTTVEAHEQYYVNVVEPASRGAEQQLLVIYSAFWRILIFLYRILICHLNIQVNKYKKRYVVCENSSENFHVNFWAAEKIKKGEHLVVWIPPKYAVSEVRGYLKGKLAIRMFRRYAYLGKQFWRRHLWSRGYCVSTVGIDKERIRQYVRWQEEKDWEVERLQGQLFKDNQE